MIVSCRRQKDGGSLVISFLSDVRGMGRLKDKGLKVKALQCLGVGALLMLLCSCVSFDIGDWPSRFVYPHNKPTANWCGSVGAFLAYYLLYYVGPGVFIVLGSGICLLTAKLAKRAVDQVFLRVVGLCLLTAAASSTFYCFWPHRLFDFPIGSGGVIGIAAVGFLRSRFAILGTAILLISTWVVGLFLLADTFADFMFGLIGAALRRIIGLVLPTWSAAREQSKVLGEIWHRLSIKQRQRDEQSAEESFTPAAPAPPAAVLRQQDAGEDAGDTVSGLALKLQPGKVPKVVKPYVPPNYEDYKLPGIDLLDEPEYGYSAIQEKVVKSKAAALEGLLNEFSISAKVVAADTGPVVTMFELQLDAGVKVSQISSLSNDIARALGVGAVRVVAPLPGKHTIGVEVPNSEKERVRMKDMLRLAGNRPAGMAIPLFLGKDSAGEALVSDLTSMPHLLIAGTTGSGKSVCINTIIAGILFTRRPDEVKMILIDPKMVEMTAFNTIPHLMTPIVTETRRAVQILEWATVQMDERYSLLAEARVKNIQEYNALGEEEILRRFEPTNDEEAAKIPKRLPYIVIVIDELADLMMTAAKEIEAYIVRLAQKSRAIGMHVVLATQRPQATVVTGLIKSNMPTRIGFRVAAKMDSRIILDQNGAETLLGQGDMLFLKPGTSDLIRAQGTFVDEAEVKRIVKHLKEVAEPQYHPELTQLGRPDTADMIEDEMFDDAVRVVLDSHRGSVSLLQRRLSVGYARASRMIEMMAGMGVLGEYKGSQAREVMMTLEEYQQVKEQMAQQHAAQQDVPEDKGEPEQPAEPQYVSEGERGYVSTEEQD